MSDWHGYCKPCSDKTPHKLLGVAEDDGCQYITLKCVDCGSAQVLRCRVFDSDEELKHALGPVLHSAYVKSKEGE